MGDAVMACRFGLRNRYFAFKRNSPQGEDSLIRIQAKTERYGVLDR